MPRKLRKEKARTELSLESFKIMELLAFTTGWSPPISEHDRRRFPRWRTWQDYFADYDAIRFQLLVSEYHHRGQRLFADRAREEMAAHPDHVFQKHTHSALLHSHLYQHGDGHVHEDGGILARLGKAIECEEMEG